EGDVALLEIALQPVVDRMLVAGGVAQGLDATGGLPGIEDPALHEVRIRLRGPVDRRALELLVEAAVRCLLLIADRLAEVPLRTAGLLVLLRDRRGDLDRAVGALDLRGAGLARFARRLRIPVGTAESVVDLVLRRIGGLAGLVFRRISSVTGLVFRRISSVTGLVFRRISSVTGLVFRRISGVTGLVLGLIGRVTRF